MRLGRFDTLQALVRLEDESESGFFTHACDHSKPFCCNGLTRFSPTKFHDFGLTTFHYARYSPVAFARNHANAAEVGQLRDVLRARRPMDGCVLKEPTASREPA